MKLKVYTDTSVFGGCFEEEFEKWSRLLINEFITGNKFLMVSGITIKELSLAPRPVRDIFEEIPQSNIKYADITDDVEKLAKQYITEKVVSAKFEGDALHIAIATLNMADVLVSWNFKHIVNLTRIRLYNSVNLKYGYPLIEIRTPMEVVDEN